MKDWQRTLIYAGAIVFLTALAAGYVTGHCKLCGGSRNAVSPGSQESPEAGSLAAGAG